MIEFDNENQDYLYNLGKRLLRSIERNYPKYYRKKSKIVEETLDKINARKLKPRLTQDELDEVLRALGVYIPELREQKKPEEGWVKIKDFVKEYGYKYVPFLESLRKSNIERQRYKKYVYARREDLEKFVFGRTGINIKDYIKFTDFLKKYKLDVKKVYVRMKGIDWKDDVIKTRRGRSLYVKKEAIGKILALLEREDRSIAGETRRMEQEGWYSGDKIAKAFGVVHLTAKKLLKKWGVENRRVKGRFCFYNIGEIIEKIKNLKEGESEGEKFVEKRKEKIIENLENLKKEKIFKIKQ